MPLNTTLEIAEPIFQPTGPSTKCAATTVKTKLQNGTIIIETTGGTIFLKNCSNCTSTNAVKKGLRLILKKDFACAKIDLLNNSICTVQNLFNLIVMFCPVFVNQRRR